MPKRYADSIAYELQKFDQLKVVVKVQTKELTTAKVYISLLELTAVHTDSLIVTKDKIAKQKTKQQNKRIKILGATVAVETALLLILLL